MTNNSLSRDRWVFVAILLVIICLAFLGLFLLKSWMGDSSLNDLLRYYFYDSPSNQPEVLRARNLWAEGKYEEMIPVAKDAISKATNNKDRATAHYWLGVAYYKLARDNEAEAEELMAIELDSSFSGPYITLSGVYSVKGDNTKALEYAQKAVQLDPQYAWAHNALGLAYANLGRKEEAVSEFKEAIRLDPDTYLFKENLTRIQD